MNFYTNKLTEQGSLLAIFRIEISHGQSHFKIYCIECGSELFSKTSIRGLKTLLRSQECPSCGYTLLFGAVKRNIVAIASSLLNA